MAEPKTQDAANPPVGDESQTTPQEPSGASQEPGNAQEPQEGSQAPEPPKWAHQLSGDLKANEYVTQHQSMNDLVSDYLNYASRSDKLVELPGDDADDATRQAFFQRLQQHLPGELRPPESADSYEIDAPEGVDTTEFKTKAHELGLSNAQAKELFSWEAQRTQQQAEQQKQAREAERAKLREEWGGEYDNRLNQVQTAFRTIAQKLGDPELAERMVKSGAGNDPDMLRTFYGIWQMIKPDSLVNGSVDGGEDSVEATWYPDTDFHS